MRMSFPAMIFFSTDGRAPLPSSPLWHGGWGGHGWNIQSIELQLASVMVICEKFSTMTTGG